jgi:hypothetical protein
MVHVPYRGDSLTVTSLLAGDVPVIVGTTVLLAGQIESGAIRGLAVTSGYISNLPQGDYHWLASYEGDTYNGAVATSCNAEGQSVTMGGLRKPTVSVDSSVPSTLAVGDPVHATATVGGGPGSGNLQFQLTGPFDAATPCGSVGVDTYSTHAIDGDLRPGEAPGAVLGNGTYTSGNVNPIQPGTYYWSVIFQSTAAGYDSAREQCGPHAAVTVTGAYTQIAPTTPYITNLPDSAGLGSGFTAQVQTNSDGIRTVTSSTPATCTADGLRVEFIAVGPCYLTPHVAATERYFQRDGDTYALAIGMGQASAPRISNLPAPGRVGDSFTADVTTTGDGPRSVTTSSPSVCTVDGLAVTFVGTGTCSLVAHVDLAVVECHRRGRLVGGFAIRVGRLRTDHRDVAQAPDRGGLSGAHRTREQDDVLHVSGPTSRADARTDQWMPGPSWVPARHPGQACRSIAAGSRRR